MQERPTTLEESIYKTVAWFALFDYAVSSFEIYKWLFEPDRNYDFHEVDQVLSSSEWLKEKLDVIEGLFVLKNSQYFSVRHTRYLDAISKFKKLRRVTKFLSRISTVRAIGAVNTLSWGHTSSTSDIDLFIVCRKGSVWTTRFLLVIPFILLGQRPHVHGEEPVSAHPLCFSFFSSEQALCFESLRIGRDPYLAQWVHSIVPMYDPSGLIEQVSEENKWSKQVVPNAFSFSVHPSFSGKKPALRFGLSFLEAFFRSLQQWRLPKHIKEHANQDSRVVITDDMLKFHENDRREQYASAHEQKVCDL